MVFNFSGIRKFSNNGASLVEIMVVSAIILIVFIAFFYGLISCFKLAEVSKESFFALMSANAKIEDMRQHVFIDVYNYYNGSKFEVAGLPANSSAGVISVDNSNPNLLKVYIAVCWRTSDGRVIGEDKNLDGILTPSEDANANNKIDSPLTLSTYIARH